MPCGHVFEKTLLATWVGPFREHFKIDWASSHRSAWMGVVSWCATCKMSIAQAITSARIPQRLSFRAESCLKQKKRRLRAPFSNSQS